MKWIKIESSNELPHDGRSFLAVWKGLRCVAQFDIEEGRFYVSFSPADYPSFQIPQEREKKFSHWMELPDIDL